MKILFLDFVFSESLDGHSMSITPSERDTRDERIQPPPVAPQLPKTSPSPEQPQQNLPPVRNTLIMSRGTAVVGMMVVLFALSALGYLEYLRGDLEKVKTQMKKDQERNEKLRRLDQDMILLENQIRDMEMFDPHLPRDFRQKQLQALKRSVGKFGDKIDDDVPERDGLRRRHAEAEARVEFFIRQWKQ